jgi:hypothetical protein
MKKLIILLALAACTTTPPSGTTPIAKDPIGLDALPKGLSDTCGAVRYHTLLEQDATALEKVLILKQVRVIRPKSIVTQDYLPERMNFHVNAANRIARISCG